MKLQVTYKNILFFLSILIGGLFMDISSVAANDLPTKQNRYISYTEIGQGESLVLIHAFPTDQQLWLPQKEGLKHYFRVITVDLWGFGHSASTDGQAITMTDYADEIKQ